MLTPLELTEKLAALIPPPRVNMIRYYGVFAPRSKLRSEVVPADEQDEDELSPTVAGGDHETASESLCAPCYRIEWARLLARVFRIDVLVCPKCSSPMQRLAFITRPDAIKKILDCVGYAADSP